MIHFFVFLTGLKSEPTVFSVSTPPIFHFVSISEMSTVYYSFEIVLLASI